MTSHSGRGRWERVLAARRQARIAQGRDPDQSDLFAAPPKPRTTQPYVPTPITATPRPSEAIGVLSLGEAAARLGVSRAALEAMIDAGKVEALPTGFTRMIPTREVERLTNPTLN
jgi:excisionase family DNA binding protein